MGMNQAAERMHRAVKMKIFEQSKMTKEANPRGRHQSDTENGKQKSNTKFDIFEYAYSPGGLYGGLLYEGTGGFVFENDHF